jgi:biopolymer transport protein ExbB/TolQ
MERVAELFHTGGVFMHINLLCAVVALAIIVDRTIFLIRSGTVNGKVLYEMLRRMILAKRLDRAIKMCSSAAGPILKVAHVALIRATQGEEAVAAAVEEAMVEITPNIKKRISSLWALANIATLLGLIGTISGLIQSFAAVGSAAAEERSTKLAAGISEAMNNTWLGLIIAVACIVAHLALSGVAKRRVAEMEAFAIKMENMLAMDSIKACLAEPQAEEAGK